MHNSTKYALSGLLGALVIAPALYYGNVGGFKASADFQRECVESGGYTPADNPDECAPNPVIQFGRTDDNELVRDQVGNQVTKKQAREYCRQAQSRAVFFEDGSSTCSNSYHEGDDINRGA